MPAAVAANLEQLHLVPEGAPIYLTCGDDDARAFAGRVPAAISRARLLVLDEPDALILTRAETLDDALGALARARRDRARHARAQGTVGSVGGERTETPSYASGPAVDTTGDRDLLCAAFAWADLRGADAAHRDRLGAALRRPRDDRPDRHGRRAERGGAAGGRGAARPPAAAGRARRPRATAASAAPITGASAPSAAGSTGSPRASAS